MTAERQLFKKAILEALSQQYEQELAECKEDAKCSKAHYIRMSEITGIPLTRLNLYYSQHPEEYKKLISKE